MSFHNPSFSVNNQTHQTYSVDLENHGNPDFYPPVQSYGTQSAPQFGSQMYGYGINTIDGINYQQLHNSELKHQDEHSMQSKRKRTLSIDGDEMDADGYIKEVESSIDNSNIKYSSTPHNLPEKAMSLQDRLAAMAASNSATEERSETGMNLQKVKVVTQKLDPSMFKPAKKSRFDQMPMSGGTGANATPLGKEPTIVLNKHVISSSLGAGKRNAQKGGRVGLTKNKDGSVQLPETTCRVDIKVQRAIMQELVKMEEFKFTIGVNRLYRGMVRNQKNKKKGHPLKIQEDINIDDLITSCEEMTHLVRVKKKRYIKLLSHITPYIRSGVNLWAMFHGRGTRRVIRDNWHYWIGPMITPQKLGMDWEFYFQCIRSMYMSCDRKQRSKYRSKFKGIEKYVVASTMWAPNKSVKLEKLVKELKCSFAIKKHAQALVNWKQVIKFVVSNITFLIIERGNFVSFHPKLRDLLAGIEVFVEPHVGKVTFENIEDFEKQLRAFCLKKGGYDWSKWDLSFRTLIKLYNCANTSIHRPDPFATTPDDQVAFSKTLRTGFRELVLPFQENRLGAPTIPAIVKRDMAKITRQEEKKAKKLAELKKAAEEKTAVEAIKKVEEEARRLVEESLQLTEESVAVPSNEEMFQKVAGVMPNQVDETAAQAESFSDISEVSEDDEEEFNFDPLYTYCQYLQPITADILYPIPGGTHLEDEIKFRVQGQPTTPGQGYGVALSGPQHSVLLVFYPYAHTMRCSHFTAGKHHHRIYADFRAAKLNLYHLTIKVKRNRFEVLTDGLCIKTVPAFMNTVGITSAMVTGDIMPFVNFRVRRVSPEVPVLPYLIKTRHQKGLLVSVCRSPEYGLVTKIGKVSGKVEMFVEHLRDLLSSDDTAPAPRILTINNSVTTAHQRVITKSSIWVLGHHKAKIKSWLKCIGF